ncbi:hypothetical protein BURKHO8Y_580009 [Burkholderia sp. 8Y]|nr:hypothetical protein BURKHO8Y_580009 [Burkholderia sp. 8Y]
MLCAIPVRAVRRPSNPQEGSRASVPNETRMFAQFCYQEGGLPHQRLHCQRERTFGTGNCCRERRAIRLRRAKRSSTRLHHGDAAQSGTRQSSIKEAAGVLVACALRIPPYVIRTDGHADLVTQIHVPLIGCLWPLN